MSDQDPQVALAKREAPQATSMASQALAAIRACTINTPDDYAWMVETLRVIKAHHKALEEKRQEITKPLNSALRSVNDLFRPALNAWKEAEQQGKLALSGFSRREEETRRAAMAASAQVYQAGGTPTAIIPEPTKVEGVIKRQVLRIEVTNADDVPRDLCSPDPKKIEERVRAMGDTRALIPGVRVWLDEQIALR